MNLNTTFNKKAEYVQNALVYSNYTFLLELKAVCTDNHVLDFNRAWIQLYSLPKELLNETY